MNGHCRKWRIRGSRVDERAAPLVGIVLVNYNGMRFTPECLQSLAAIDYPNVRTVLVDNASTDGSPEWIAEHRPEVTLIRLPSNRGVTGGNNAGIAWCLSRDCDYVLLLNNDTVVEPDFLTWLVAAAEPRALVAPKILFCDARETLNNHFGVFDFWRGRNTDWLYNHPAKAADKPRIGRMSSTCALLISRDVLLQVGRMDDAYFLYYDDTDFIARAVARGAIVKFAPEAVICHRESSSAGHREVSPLAMYYNTRNRLYFMFKHQKNPFALLFFVAYFCAGRVPLILHYAATRRLGLARALLNGVMDFLRGRMGAAAGRY
jgi:GT2 family glycosyltransferase